MVDYGRGIKAGLLAGLLTGIIFTIILSVLIFSGYSASENESFASMIANPALYSLGIGLFVGLILGLITSNIVSKTAMEPIYAIAATFAILLILVFGVSYGKLNDIVSILSPLKAQLGPNMSLDQFLVILFVIPPLFFAIIEGLLLNSFWNVFKPETSKAQNPVPGQPQTRHAITQAQNRAPQAQMQKMQAPGQNSQGQGLQQQQVRPQANPYPQQNPQQTYQTQQMRAPNTGGQNAMNASFRQQPQRANIQQDEYAIQQSRQETYQTPAAEQQQNRSYPNSEPVQKQQPQNTEADDPEGVRHYVQQDLDRGVDPEELKARLEAYGYDPSVVDEILINRQKRFQQP